MNTLGSLMNHYNLYKWESETSDLSLNDSNQDYLDIAIGKINFRIYRIYRIFHFNLFPRKRSKR